MKMRIIVVGALTVLLPVVSPARDYSANLGRFMTMDTYEGSQSDPQSLHKYAYVHDNPVNLTDPSGHAVYFVERKLSMDYGKLAYYLGDSGHGYLLITKDTDPGNHNPLTHGYPAIATFSWHPYTWNYTDPAQGYIAAGNQKVPGRVWENHSDDTHPSSYHPYLVTANPAEQAAILRTIRNYINSQPCGYELGKPRAEFPGSDNTIGDQQHRQAPETGIYYSVLGQNCVWWATAMVMQNNVALPNDTRKAIMNYNYGGGAASQILSGNRNATTYHTMNDILEGMSLPGGYNVDVGSIGLGGL